MNRIKDLKTNENVLITLVVLSATARETRVKKPYLQLEMFDGTDKIQGNYWDWNTGKIPEANAILDISAQVTEYMGQKQLNIKQMKLNTERHISEFEPKADIDVAAIYKEAYAASLLVGDDFLRALCIECLEQLYDLWLKVPGAKGVHHAFVGGTLVHSLSVAKIAKSISQLIPESNNDLCFVGGLLHDLGKLFTYKLEGLIIGMSDEGMLYDHTYIGARFINNFAEQFMKDGDELKLELLEHIILSHHGLLEYGAAVPPMCIEAHIVNKADGVDASVQQVLEASRKLGNVKWTDKIYTLGNKPQITAQYVEEVFRREIPEDELPFL